jgi:hypothetical protein
VDKNLKKRRSLSWVAIVHSAIIPTRAHCSRFCGEERHKSYVVLPRRHSFKIRLLSNTFCKLPPVQLGIQAAARQQLGMRAFLDHASGLDYQNFVRL